MPHFRFSTGAVLLASLVIGAAPPASAQSFPTVVRAVLNAQTDGRLASMGASQRAEMTDCVISTLAGLPGGQKKYIAAGASLDEQTDRFGEVVQADRAKWKQKIASVCGKIAMQKTTGNNK
jgi:hypothetical protein